MKNIALFIAAVLTAIARAEEHDNAETSIAKSLVKIVYQQGSQYNYACTGVSVGEGLFLTASACIGRNNWIYDKSKKRYKAEVLKKGVSYGIGANKHLRRRRKLGDIARAQTAVVAGINRRRRNEIRARLLRLISFIQATSVKQLQLPKH